MGLVLKSFISVIALTTSFAFAQEKRVKVVSWYERAPGDLFYEEQLKYVKAAANNLNIDLQVEWAHGDHIKMPERVRKIVESPQKPDAMIFVAFQGVERKAIEYCEKQGVKVIIYEVDVEKSIGKPRSQFKNLIGQVLADNRQAGFELAKELVSAAKAGPDGKVKIIGITGQPGHGAAIERAHGLEDYVKSDSKTELVQKPIFVNNWDGVTAKSKLQQLLKRYKNPSVVWAASDGIALGASEELKAQGLNDTVTGGVDWSNGGLSGIKSGQISASAGGHIFLPVWSLVLIRDYFNNKDFASESLVFKTKFSVLTQQNLVKFLKVTTTENLSKVDFNKFTKSNGKIDRYDFSFSNVMRVFSNTK